ncbi:MAG: hypothetical protein AB1508_19210 [Pseudomonadota bacterium]
MRLLQKDLFFSDENQVMEKLKHLRAGEYLVGFSPKGIIEVQQVGESVYSVEFHSPKSKVTHAINRPLRLPGVSLALRVVLDDGRGGNVGEYEFAMFDPSISDQRSGVSCLP